MFLCIAQADSDQHKNCEFKTVAKLQLWNSNKNNFLDIDDHTCQVGLCLFETRSYVAKTGLTLTVTQLVLSSWSSWLYLPRPCVNKHVPSYVVLGCARDQSQGFVDAQEALHLLSPFPAPGYAECVCIYLFDAGLCCTSLGLTTQLQSALSSRCSSCLSLLTFESKGIPHDTWLELFFIYLYFMCVSVLSRHIVVHCVVCAVPLEARSRRRIPRSWAYRWLWWLFGCWLSDLGPVEK